MGESTSPEIDGIVRIADVARLASGRFARVVVTASDEYDLAARVVA